MQRRSISWSNAAVTSVPAGTRTAFLRYEFETAQYPKSYFGPGIQMAADDRASPAAHTHFVPIEVTYCWIEHREVRRRRTAAHRGDHLRPPMNTRFMWAASAIRR